MDLDTRLQAIDAALLQDEDVTPAVDALLAEATTPGQKFAIHARLADLFATCDESPDRALFHARLATSYPLGPTIANQPELLASALSLLASKEEDSEALRQLIASAEGWARTWPVELTPTAVDIRFSLARQLAPGAEAEGNARALVALTEREESRRRYAEAQFELARTLAKAGARTEAGLWARRVVAPREPPSASAVEAFGLLAELEAPAPEADELVQRGVEMAREVDRIPGEGFSAAWAILASGIDPPEFPQDTSDAVWHASYGKVEDPVTLGDDGAPTPGGLASQRIFGPCRDLTCGCGRYSGLRSYQVVCEVCGVQVRTPQLRTWRMGHLSLRSVVVHPRWTRMLAARWHAPHKIVARLALQDDYDSGYEAWEAREREYEGLRGPESTLSKQEAVQALRIKVLPVLPPDARGSTGFSQPLRRAYEALIAVNQGEGDLQKAVDALFDAVENAPGLQGVAVP